jgi:hypothetical protein
LHTPQTNASRVPFSSLVPAVAPLDRLDGALDDEELPLLAQPARPALDDGGARVLVKDPVRLQAVVRVLPHEHLRLAELHVRLREGHGHGLALHSPDLLRPRDARLVRVERLRPVRGGLPVLGTLSKHDVDE